MDTTVTRAKTKRSPAQPTLANANVEKPSSFNPSDKTLKISTPESSKVDSSKPTAAKTTIAKKNSLKRGVAKSAIVTGANLRGASPANAKPVAASPAVTNRPVTSPAIAKVGTPEAPAKAAPRVPAADTPIPGPTPKAQEPSAYDRKVALVLQGGGALGSYQAGVYEALAETRYRPDWVAGISVGAINAAIIAGNAPEHRVEKLREFWEVISAPSANWPMFDTDFWGAASRKAGAFASIMFGQPGFFKPSYLDALIWGAKPTSYYSTDELKATLERLVDFDRINSQETRLSVGAVNVRTGNFAFFDNTEIKIRPEHVMASGALPPGFPAVEIDGEFYWDGGLVSNTPLYYVLSATPRHSMLVFQVDLFPAEGPLPTNLDEVTERQKDIQYSSRTRMSTNTFQAMHEIRHNVSKLLKKIPDELRNEPEAIALQSVACQTNMDIVELIYRPAVSQGASKDYEFSRMTMEARWAIGRDNAKLHLDAEPWLTATRKGGVRSFDLIHTMMHPNDKDYPAYPVI